MKPDTIDRICDPENQAKTRFAAGALFEELNEALGLPTPNGDPFVAASAHNRQRINMSALKACVEEFNRLRDEGIGATLHEDVWKAFKRPGA